MKMAIFLNIAPCSLVLLVAETTRSLTEERVENVIDVSCSQPFSIHGPVKHIGFYRGPVSCLILCRANNRMQG
jgi:hypothetical protein